MSYSDGDIPIDCGMQVQSTEGGIKSIVCSQINYLPYQRPLTDLKTNITLITLVYNAENLVKIGQVGLCRFLPKSVL